MKNFRNICLFFLLSLFVSPVFAQGEASAREKKTKQEPHLEWISFKEAMKRSESEPRPLLIDVYTDWCGWCKKMDKATFEDPHVMKALADDYYAVKLDAEMKDSIQVGDKMYRFVPSGRRGYHELAAALLNGRMSYPSIVFLDKQFNLIQDFKGFRGPKEMHPIISFFAGDYKSTTWEEFQKTYKSPYAAQ